LGFVWERISQRPIKTVIDVGAAEGYLAVGAALLFPRSHVIAYEAMAGDREAMARLAAFNGVANRVRCEGFCDGEQLTAALTRAEIETLVIMDIEGGELELLDPGRIPALRSSTILVETHDFKVQGCVRNIIDRFEKTHAIEKVSSRPRRRQDIPFWLPSLLSKWFIDASSDFRSGEQEWLYMVPR
jgi:hypothetical protein